MNDYSRDGYVRVDRTARSDGRAGAGQALPNLLSRRQYAVCLQQIARRDDAGRVEKGFSRRRWAKGPTNQVYVFKDCPMIKLDVRCEKSDNPNDYFKPDNKIQNFGRL
jgi:hypothetical protein